MSQTTSSYLKLCTISLNVIGLKVVFKLCIITKIYNNKMIDIRIQYEFNHFEEKIPKFKQNLSQTGLNYKQIFLNLSQTIHQC
jgi:hypothetical protein